MTKEKPSKLVKKRLGRPPISQQAVRNNRLVTFVTDEELQRINKIAKKKQQSLSAACRDILSNFLMQENNS